MIKRAAVIGSGVMGKGIAAHLANCGISTLLLDLDRSMVEQSLQQLPKMKPSLLYDQRDLRLITPGSITDDLAKTAECDWIVEVIVEQLGPKQALYAKLESQLTQGQVISSNTSGISWERLTEGRGDLFKQQFCITHFFNPVRYLKLVELVGGSATHAHVMAQMEAFLRDTLGKGVVHAKDTPNFIANRIGVHGVMAALHYLVETRQCPAVIDKVMGPALGRPKSAIFRTADIVGLDTLAHVAQNSYERCPDDEARALYKLPAFYEQLLKDGALGEKSGKGFYFKTKGADGEKTILAYNIDKGGYDVQAKLKTPSLGAAREIEDVAERMRTVVFADDDAGKIAWSLVSQTLVYAANRVPEIANDIVNVDRAMEWGFGWELGPFATWDALGVQTVVDRLTTEGRPVPALATQVLSTGKGSFYETVNGSRTYFDIATSKYSAVPQKPGLVILNKEKATKQPVAKNESAQLWDIGDGVLCCEFQSKMNAIDADIIAMLNEGMDRVERDGVGLLVGNEGANFCVGANLMLIFLEAQAKNWEKIDEIARQFQGVCQRMRFLPKPVVAAPFQLVLGGGCEIVLGAGHVRAAAETYIGLVELGVGLVPAGAGCKNMLLRAEAQCTKRLKDHIWMSPADGGPFPKVERAFEAIGFAKVATSAKEAQGIGYLAPTDRITLDTASLLADAKADILELAQDYAPPVMREDISLPGEGGYYAMRNAMEQFHAQGVISAYDQHLGERLAHILTGSNHPSAHLATENDILDREREVFLSLCGQEQSLERISHMLMTGKPLRN